MRPNPQETADLVTFTEEIFNGKLHFLCGVPNERPLVLLAEYQIKIHQEKRNVRFEFVEVLEVSCFEIYDILTEIVKITIFF